MFVKVKEKLEKTRHGKKMTNLKKYFTRRKKCKILS